MTLLRGGVESGGATAMSQAGTLSDEALDQILRQFEGIYFAKGAFRPEGKLTEDALMEALYDLAVKTYEAKETAYTPNVMRELERVVMLRVVDEYWMDNIDAMDDLKQGIGLRAYGQHDPVVAYKEEGYELFQAMINAIREETIRRMFLVRIQPRQEVKREKVAKETSTAAAGETQVKKVPVRNAAKKVGPNDPCPCGSGKKYKKCCMQKDKKAD